MAGTRRCRPPCFRGSRTKVGPLAATVCRTWGAGCSRTPGDCHMKRASCAYHPTPCSASGYRGRPRSGLGPRTPRRAPWEVWGRPTHPALARECVGVLVTDPYAARRVRAHRPARFPLQDTAPRSRTLTTPAMLTRSGYCRALPGKPLGRTEGLQEYAGFLHGLSKISAFCLAGMHTHASTCG